MQLRSHRYGGPRHSGELMVLEAELKATTITPNAMEAAFASLSKLSRDRVFAMFRVPPKLLGISDEAGGNDKSTDFQRVFDTKTMQPFMEKLQRRRHARAHAGVGRRLRHRLPLPDAEGGPGQAGR